MQESRRETRQAGPVGPGGGAGDGGPPAAFEEVYLRFAPLLRKVAVRKFRIAPADADTLVHDVFATYFTYAGEVNAVEPYLIGAICNASRYHLRRSHAANALFCAETPCAATPPDALLKEVERKILLTRILARVGGRCRDLLHRYYILGEATKTIAEAYQFKAATVLVLLHKCRQRALSAYHSMAGRS
jgi:RNA polymerase sigma factor (sigma-70 family)